MPIAVTFTLPEQSLPQIRAADGQPLTVVAVTRDNQTEIARGQLTAFDSSIDPTTGTIKLKATFPNLDKKLWPGQFVNARLLVRTERKVLTLPAPAVQLGPNGSYVYRVQRDQTVQMQLVTVGQSEGNVVMIASGLNAGDQIVVDGQSRLQPGSKIQLPDAAGGDNTSSSSSGGAATAGQGASADAAAGADGQHPHHHHRHDHSGEDNSGSSSGGASGTAQ